MDHDKIEMRNVVDGRTVYSKSDLGKYKVYALREKIQAVYPETRVTAHRRNVMEISPMELAVWAESADAALVGIDEGNAILRLNEAFCPRITTYYQGVHPQGRSGQIIITRPGSPCLKCCMQVQSPQEVQTLHREPGLGIHFGMIAQITVQLVIQELAARWGSRLGPPLDPRVNLLYVTNMKERLTPFAPGIIPFHIERSPECTICSS